MVERKSRRRRGATRPTTRRSRSKKKRQIKQKSNKGKTIEPDSTFEQGDAAIDFYTEFYSGDEADKILKELYKLPYEDSYIKMFKGIRMPRKMMWFSDNPDWTYVFSKKHIDGLKAHKFTKLLNKIRHKVEKTVGKPFNSLLVNYYKDEKDSVDWHNDDDPWLGSNFIVPSLSFGAERAFKLKENKKGRGVSTQTWNLKPGSMLVMKEMTQKSHLHSVPKSTKKIGPRINLTFRNVVPELVYKQPKPAKRSQVTSRSAATRRRKSRRA